MMELRRVPGTLCLLYVYPYIHVLMNTFLSNIWTLDDFFCDLQHGLFVFSPPEGFNTSLHLPLCYLPPGMLTYAVCT